MNLASETWPALCLIAVSLGLRHGFDADHLTVIDGLVRRNAAFRPRLARLAGVLFSIGHGAVVLMVACTTVALAARWHIPTWLEPVGILISVVVLLTLAALNLYAVWATPRSATVTPVGLRSKLFSRAFASDHPLTMAGIGALFAISADTLAQAAALGIAAAQFGGVGQAALVAGWFAAGTAVASGLAGYWMARLLRTTNQRAAIASRVMTGAIGLMSLTVAMVMIASLLFPHGALAVGSSIWAGAAIIVAAAAAFLVAMLASRGGGKPQRAAAVRTGGEQAPNVLARECSDAPSIPEGWSEAA